jgi:glycosyltransferase involved in cell wall biosynthesis
MRVLQLGPYPPPQGGINRNMLAIREELRKVGHECAVIAITKSAKITNEPDVYYPSNPLALIRLLLKLEYDVLHIHIGGELLSRVLGLLLICGILAKGKNVLTLHSGGFAVSEDAQNAKPASFKGFIFRQFARIICVNTLMLEVFENYGVEKERIRLIYPFYCESPDEKIVVPPQLKEFAEKHHPFLLSVGLLEPDYDLFTQIDALEKLRKKFPGAGLMIVGSGSLEAELREAISEREDAENICLAGDVPHPITLHLINDADVLLRTTLFDGDAISVREALHLDTPVIATDNGMRPKEVHLIPTSDVEALAAAIESIVSREKMPKTRKADDRTNIKAVVNLYEEILQDRTSDSK